MLIDRIHFTPWASLAGGLVLAVLAGMFLFELGEWRAQRAARAH